MPRVADIARHVIARSLRRIDLWHGAWVRAALLHTSMVGGHVVLATAARVVAAAAHVTHNVGLTFRTPRGLHLGAVPLPLAPSEPPRGRSSSNFVSSSCADQTIRRVRRPPTPRAERGAGAGVAIPGVT